jgi:hypothetical protein
VPKPKKLTSPSEQTKTPAKAVPTMALFERAQKGDKSCQEELDALMDDPEQGASVVEFFGNIAERAELRLIEKITGDNLAGKAGMLRKMARLRSELAGPKSSPIVRLLAERAAYCWLNLWYYEQSLIKATGLNFKQAEFHQRRIDAAHRRFCSALRSLAAVRKLALPAVQLNIAENQINFSGGD